MTAKTRRWKIGFVAQRSGTQQATTKLRASGPCQAQGRSGAHALGGGWEKVLSDWRQDARSECWRTGANVEWLGVDSNYL